MLPTREKKRIIAPLQFRPNPYSRWVEAGPRVDRQGTVGGRAGLQEGIVVLQLA